MKNDTQTATSTATVNTKRDALLGELEGDEIKFAKKARIYRKNFAVNGLCWHLCLGLLVIMLRARLRGESKGLIQRLADEHQVDKTVVYKAEKTVRMLTDVIVQRLLGEAEPDEGFPEISWSHLRILACHPELPEDDAERTDWLNKHVSRISNERLSVRATEKLLAQSSASSGDNAKSDSDRDHDQYHARTENHVGMEDGRITDGPDVGSVADLDKDQTGTEGDEDDNASPAVEGATHTPGAADPLRAPKLERMLMDLLGQVKAAKQLNSTLKRGLMVFAERCTQAEAAEAIGRIKHARSQWLDMHQERLQVIEKALRKVEERDRDLFAK